MATQLNILKYALKDAKGEKLTLYERVNMYIDNTFRYSWGIKHVRQFYYSMKCLCNRHDLIRTNLGKTGYHDKPELILHGIMNLVVEFVETERAFELVDFNNGTQWEHAGVTIMEVYEWWKDRPNREKEVGVSLDNWYNHSVANNGDGIILRINAPRPSSAQAQRYFDIHTHLEDKLRLEDDKMLGKVIEIRAFLWT